MDVARSSLVGSPSEPRFNLGVCARQPLIQRKEHEIKPSINRAAWDTPQGEASLLQLIPHGRVGDVAKAAVWSYG